MRKTIASAALAALVALPLIAGPTGASASCRGRANTGTVIGGVGGALVGNSISHGGGGAVIGGLGGAVLGHEIGKSGCTSSTHRAYYRRGHSHYAANHRSSQVYYDQNGNPVYRR
ncbi:glycine zipper 2TM domain-containing protein [Phenylobacterium sp.]|uniref:glycine zipper 2TM domain-containing protein n=1 Tax=Phenylobacterium sp. TaxID=1871053 RepID=UPI002DF663DB|nr:glycine zipper 2TM domain-containing protein [Phenylobacterium sp.]